ncbi:hypothetical protein DL89DRAFT_266933, partial [Linderina pennispora]
PLTWKRSNPTSNSSWKMVYQNMFSSFLLLSDGYVASELTICFTNSRQNENSTDMGDTISQYLHMHLPALTSISSRDRPHFRTYIRRIFVNWSYAFTSESSDSFDFSELKGRSICRKLSFCRFLTSLLQTQTCLLPHLSVAFDSLNIVGGIDVLTQMNLRFPFSERISLRLSDNAVEDTQEYSTFTESIFSSFSVATWARLEVEHYIPVSINSELNIPCLHISAPLFIAYYLSYPYWKHLCVESYHYDKQHRHFTIFPWIVRSSARYTSRFPLVFDP